MIGRGLTIDFGLILSHLAINIVINIVMKPVFILYSRCEDYLTVFYDYLFQNVFVLMIQAFP